MWFDLAMMKLGEVYNLFRLEKDGKLFSQQMNNASLNVWKSWYVRLTYNGRK
jgi:hypothetical protein